MKSDLIAGLPVKGTLLEIFRSKGIGHKVADDLDCTRGLVKYIDGAEKSLDFGIYSLTSRPIVDALLRAHERGVLLRGVADNTQWAGHYSLNHELLAVGVDIIRAIHQHACMHLKVAVIDNHICALGSFNWTKNAQEHNDECLLVFDSLEAAEVLALQIKQARELNLAR